VLFRSCRIKIEDSHLIIENPWNSENIRLSFDLLKFDEIMDLNNIIIIPNYDAIVHLDTNRIEFIYGYLAPGEEPAKSIVNRKFLLNFEGNKLLCEYSEPTQRLMLIAKGFRRLPSDKDTIVPQIRAFRDIQQIEKYPQSVRQYFKDAIPRNFFVLPDKPIRELDFVNISRHINFIMRYYDRETPQIIIRKDENKLIGTIKPCRFINKEFPSELSINNLDEFMLQLIEVARDTTKIFSFVYYYQALEYASYCFIEKKKRSDLIKILKDPSIVCCDEEKITQLIGYLPGLIMEDEMKIQKVIEEDCDPRILWRDVNENIQYFSQKVLFEGGVEIPPLISSEITEDEWPTVWMPKTFNNITNIRNCIVHARERRNSNSIIPTITNSEKIIPYLALIERIVEQIIINRG
jgi:hypothetical protein